MRKSFRVFSIGVMLIVPWPLLAQVQAPAPCRGMAYPAGEVENPPLAVTEVKGVAVDAVGVGVTGACVALFTDERELIAVVQADEDGWFTIPEVGVGDYRIVVRAESFCPTNARVRIVKRKLLKRALHAHMKAAGGDLCSFIMLK